MENPVEFLRRYLGEYFPGQPLEIRCEGADVLVVEVTDPGGARRELKFSVDALPKAGGGSALVQFPGSGN